MAIMTESAVTKALYPLHELATDLAAEDIDNGATQSNDFESFGAVLFNLLEAHQYQYEVSQAKPTTDPYGQADLALARQNAQDTITLAELARDFNEVTRLRLRMVASGSHDQYTDRHAESLEKAAVAVNNLVRDILLTLGIAVTASLSHEGFPPGEVLRNGRAALAQLLDRDEALKPTASSIDNWRDLLVTAHRALLAAPDWPVGYDPTDTVLDWVTENQGRTNAPLTRGRIAAGVKAQSWEVARVLADPRFTYTPSTGWTAT
ncbi:hypothetical protein ACWCYY_34890 [Kitasatospora sp. NPDC001664]